MGDPAEQHHRRPGPGPGIGLASARVQRILGLIFSAAAAGCWVLVAADLVIDRPAGGDVFIAVLNSAAAAAFWWMASASFPLQRKSIGAASMLRVSRLVEPVVFHGEIYGAGGRACGQEAQFQDVFKGACARGNGVVFGHAEGVGHAGLLDCSGGSVLSQYRLFLQVGWKSLRPRQRPTRPEEPWRGRPPRTWGRSRRGRPDPLGGVRPVR